MAAPEAMKKEKPTGFWSFMIAVAQAEPLVVGGWPLLAIWWFFKRKEAGYS